ncbi:MAG: hypothetical protein ACPG19_13960 [Saprospiraceae bacterium]
MRNIQRVGWLFLVVVTLIQVSCTRADYIDREESQVVGEWYFDRVRIVKPFNIDNITNEYNDAEIDFFEDYTVIYTQDNGDVLEGSWTFNIVDGGEERVNQLVLQLEDANGNDVLFLWDDFNVTNRRMWAQEDYDDNGQITYRLRRR